MNKPARGFTLIELMIGITITGIFLALGLPTLENYINNNRIARASEEFQMGLMFAKTEAIKRNGPIQFQVAGTSWNVLDNATNLMSRASEASENRLAIAASAASVSYSPTGRMTLGANFTIDVTSPTYGSCAQAGGKVRCLRVVATPGGAVTVCDPALPSTNPAGC